MHSLAKKSPILAELASEWDFFGDLGRDLKIPKKNSCLNPGDMKSPKDAEWKLPKSRGSKFIFSGYPEIPKWWRPRARIPDNIKRI